MQQWLCPVGVASDGSVCVAWTERKRLEIWDLDTGKRRFQPAPPQPDLGAYRLAIPADGKRFFVSLLGPPEQKVRASTVAVGDTAAGTLTTLDTGHTNIIYRIDCTPDGKLLVTGSFDGTLRLWDAAWRRRLATMNVPGKQPLGLAISPNGRWIAGATSDGAIHMGIWPNLRPLKSRRFQTSTSSPADRRKSRSSAIRIDLRNAGW